MFVTEDAPGWPTGDQHATIYCKHVDSSQTMPMRFQGRTQDVGENGASCKKNRSNFLLCQKFPTYLPKITGAYLNAWLITFLLHNELHEVS